MEPSDISQISTEAMALGSLFSAIAGAILSAAFKRIPKLSDWYIVQSKEMKSGLMFVMVVLAAVGVAAWTCSDGACAGGGDWKVYAIAIWSAATANQSTHSFIPTPQRLKGPHEGQA